VRHGPILAHLAFGFGLTIGADTICAADVGTVAVVVDAGTGGSAILGGGALLHPRNSSPTITKTAIKPSAMVVKRRIVSVTD
jgi:hypothetical protein